MKIKKQKDFANGSVFALELSDGKLIETTDTFLPFYTKDAIGRKQNTLKDNNMGDRSERWMIGVSVSSSCPIRCKFCATGQMKSKFRNLTAEEIVEQVNFVIDKNGLDPTKSKELKINYTRMGDFALNQKEVVKAIGMIDEKYPNTHHYLSTIGIKGTDFSFIKDNITLQLSLHSFDENHRDWLIPYKNKMSVKELGEVRTKSNLKTTINMTLVDESDFNIVELRKYFDPEHFFIKLSPINVNETSELNECGNGVIESINLK
jgi:adenine C2-methylase RlmN of 23S rRNA A2503 and tRNA A37